MGHPLDPGTISSERDYAAALDELDRLMLCDPDTPSGRRFDELVALIEAWELAHDPAPDRPPGGG
jgi:antitoxin component HigA of HigAB toxin-antitoxin module